MKMHIKFLSSIITLFVCSIGMLLTSCNKSKSFSYNSPVDTLVGPQLPPITSAKRMLALGDSYTIGQGVLLNQTFANQTLLLLKQAGANVATSAQIIARTGWATQGLLTGITTANPPPTGPYQLVTLLIGVNNQYQNLDTAQYRIQFIDCLNKAVFFAGNKKENVFVLSIPDYGATPFGASNATQIGLEIDRHNAINKQVCLQMAVNYTDITPSTRMAATNPTLLCSDSLHPSGVEYAKWAAMLVPKMLPRVQ